MAEYTKNRKWPPDDPFFYRDGLDEVDLPEDVRVRRDQARAQARARRPGLEPSDRNVGSAEVKPVFLKLDGPLPAILCRRGFGADD